MAQAVLEVYVLPPQASRDQLHVCVRKKLRWSEEEAQEMEVLGRWLRTQCDGPIYAIPRLGKRLYKLDDGRAWDTLQDVLQPLVLGELSQGQINAIDDLRLAFKK